MKPLGWVLLFATVFVADYLVLGWGVDRLVGARLRRAEAARAWQERTLQEVEIVAERRHDFEAEVERSEQKLAGLRAILPDDPGLGDLEETLRGAAAAVGVAIVKVSIHRAKELDFYVVRPVEVTVRGSDAGLAQFLSRLGAQPRLMSLQSLQAARQGEQLSVRLGLETYSFLPS